MEETRQSKVNELLEEVLALEPLKRQEYLKNSGVDEEILKEIETLLSFEEEAEGALNLSAVEFSRDFFDEDQQNPLIGQQIGVYEIVRELGFGGMGAVYLAERTDGKFSQRVALKLLKREMNTTTLRRRFQHEQEILGSLEHPNIARLLDAGTTADKIPYLAMEYIEGVPMDTFCHRQNLNLEQRLDLFRKVCSAVDFAHRNLIVHRDLKPSNILVTEDGIPKLLDFGISKILTSEFGNANSATITKMGVMTPSYASPEQLQSKSVTTATDIYSLGIILFELLSGHRPFEEKERDLKEIYKAVLETDPPLPSTLVETTSNKLIEPEKIKTEIKDLPKSGAVTEPILDRTGTNQIHLTVPQKVGIKAQSLKGDLDNIILKALKKEPERRYSSAENLSEDIRRYQKGLPVSARPDTFSYRAGKFIKRNSLAVGAAVLILLAIVGGVVATLWQARIAQAERAKAEKRFNDVRSLANSFLFEITPEIENLSGSTRARELLVKRALEYLDALAKESGDDPELQRELATAYEKVGDVQGNPYEPNIGDMEGALKSYEKARNIRTALFSENNDTGRKAEMAKNTQLIGDVLFFSGEIEKAGEYYRQAVTSQNEILQQNPTDPQVRFDLALARIALGTFYFWNSNYKEALNYYEPAREILESLNQSDPENDVIIDKLANTYVKIGETLAWQSEPEKAEKDILKGLQMIEPVVRRNPNIAMFRKSLWTANIKAGEVYLDMENFDKSLNHYEKALELAKITAAADPKNVVAKRDLALSYNKVGDTLDASGNGQEALTNARQALKLQEEMASADPKNFDIRYQIANTHKRMGYAQTTMKDHKGARESFQKALKEYEQLAVLDPDDEKLPREVAVVYQTIGETYLAAAASSRKTENLQKALEWIEKSHKIFREMKAGGTLPEFDNSLITDTEKQIAEINKQLGKN